MIRMGLVGLGGMGRGHLTTLEQLIADGADIELVALCDINPKAFQKSEKVLNLEGMEKDDYDFSKYHLYYSVDDMLAAEKDLDIVNVVVPTYEHSTVACKVMNAGIHCLSEKPMAVSLAQCQLMIDTAKKNNVRLMIGQCERFNNSYSKLKEIIDEGTLGAPIGGYFWRGGSAPKTEWFFCREKGGGGLFDQHVHDVDMVQWLYGMPKAVSTVGRAVRPGSGYDTSATNYLYDGKLCVHSSNIWVSNEPGFAEGFRADFEKGTVLWVDGGEFKVYDLNEQLTDIKPNFEGNSCTPYYEEIEYFIDLVKTGKENTINPPESSMESIRLALAEMKSADLGGQVVEL